MSRPNLEDNTYYSILKDEYLQVQKAIEDFDTRSLTIKAWSVSFSLVIMGGAFLSKQPLPFMIGGISALLFWYIEARWKTFQDAHYARSNELERYFYKGAAGGEKPYPLQIGHSWQKRWKEESRGKLFKLAFWEHVALPHAFVFLTGVGLYAAAKLGLLIL